MIAANYDGRAPYGAKHAHGSTFVQSTLAKGAAMCRKVSVSGKIDALEICDIGLRRYREAVVAGRIGPESAMPCLLHLGLLVPAADGMLTPVPPATAAHLTLEPLRQKVAHYQRRMAALEPSFAAAAVAYTAAQQNTAGDVRTIQGADMISAALQLAVDMCVTELLTVQPGGRRPPELLDRALTSELPALRRGVAQRTIYQHTVRSHPPTMDYVRQISMAGAEVRTVDEVVDRLVICDNAVAFIPAGPDRADQALEIRNEGMIHFLRSVFENTWQRAQQIDSGTAQTRPPEVVDDIQNAIARFLIEGHTDAKIARQLGMSRRTVATHIRRIADQLGSTSRAQLGYLIATRYVLDR